MERPIRSGGKNSAIRPKVWYRASEREAPALPPRLWAFAPAAVAVAHEGSSASYVIRLTNKNTANKPRTTPEISMELIRFLVAVFGLVLDVFFLFFLVIR